MKIYFSGSIRGGREDAYIYENIISLLKNYGEVLTEHIGDIKLPILGEGNGSDDENIYERDMDWLRSCDILVAEVTVNSNGVGYEIGYADSLKKKVVCLFRESGKTNLSGMINGNKNIKVYNYKDLSEIPNILEELFK